MTDTNSRKAIGISVNQTLRPAFSSITVTTSRVRPAISWLVVPKSGQISMPPSPFRPPAPKASSMQLPTARNVATQPFWKDLML